MKVIKRYANRRLYDSDTSRTITLEEVAQFVRAGEEIKVVDNISQEDITGKVLVQTFLKIHEPKSNEPLVNFILTALIRESGSGFFELVKKLIFAGIGVSQMPNGERESVIKAMVKLKDTSKLQSDVLLDLADKGKKETSKLWGGLKGKVDELTTKVQSAVLASLEPLERSQNITNVISQIDDFSKSMRNLLLKSEEKKKPSNLESKDSSDSDE